MSDTTRHPAPDERALTTTTALPTNTLNITKHDTTPGKTSVTMPLDFQMAHSPTPTPLLAHHPPNTTLLPQLVEALNTDHATLNHMVMTLPDTWGETNIKGTLITKHVLRQCLWGAHTESDGLHNLQQAIITAYPPTHTNVTQYTCHLTSAISRDSSVWQHTIRNACQNHILPHPLHNPITIFNINHNAHYTTLITDPHHYSYYDPLNFPIPQITRQIHNSLRQWYSNTAIAPPLLHTESQHITAKSTPKQTDN